MIPPELATVTASFDDASKASDAERVLLEEWARKRGTLLRFADAAPRAISFDGSVDDVEELFDRARRARVEGKVDEDAARIREAMSLLEHHPEWPEAAWLLAEAWRAAGLANQARALDGTRIRGVAESLAPPKTDEGPVPMSSLVLQLEIPSDAAFVDGRAIADYPTDDSGAGRSLAKGRHALLVTRGGRTVHAEWLDLDAPRTRVVPSPSWACSETDLTHGGEVDCRAWVRVRRERGALRVAACVRATCEETETILFFQAPRHKEKPSRPHAPVWLTVTAIGASVALFSLGALMTSGSFDRDPVPVRFVSGGVRPASSGGFR